jgi:hypothetical protein
MPILARFCLNFMDQTPEVENPDSAAIFASALSLWQACHEKALCDKSIELSKCYKGVDQFMRVVMCVAHQFETWACEHIVFEELEEVWPYLLEEHFGEACLEVVPADAFTKFDDSDCLRVALRLGLSIRTDKSLPLPIAVSATNPTSGSGFRAFRIQTVRDNLEDNDAIPFTSDNDPFDSDFGPPYFALYGICDGGPIEHIADRSTYSDAVNLVIKLAPGVQFPTVPNCTGRALPIRRST